MAVDDVMVNGNHTAGTEASGGGIAAYDVTLTDSAVNGNSTTGASQGRRDRRLVDVYLTSSTVSGNSTAGDYADGWRDRVWFVD